MAEAPHITRDLAPFHPSTRGALAPGDLAARLIHRDASVLVLDKPAGIAVHKGPGRGGNLEEHFHELAFGLPRPPALAHRLDRETSGCLVLGRHRQALARLGKIFASGKAEKTYWAIVVGHPPETGTIALPLARRSHDKRSWWMKAAPDGDPALTDFTLITRGDGVALLSLSPKTGRTHQLRVHCAESGFPIAGDKLYGGDVARIAAPMLMLHARAIVLPFSAGKPPIAVRAPVPALFAGTATGLGLTLPEGTEIRA